MKLIESSEKKPLRIFTHVSENDNRAKDPEETYHNWVMANERTAAALKAKGYDYRYVNEILDGFRYKMRAYPLNSTPLRST